MIGLHTMQPLAKGGWSVGYYTSTTLNPCKWVEICQFAETEDAVRRVSRLNGGPE